jgi:hypothetical protein
VIELVKRANPSVLDRAYDYYDLLLFRAPEALAIIAIAEKEKWELLGFDGFIIERHVRQPVQEYSFDYTDGDRKHVLRYEHAAKFLRDRIADDVFYELVFAED